MYVFFYFSLDPFGDDHWNECELVEGVYWEIKLSDRVSRATTFQYIDGRIFHLLFQLYIKFMCVYMFIYVDKSSKKNRFCSVHPMFRVFHLFQLKFRSFNVSLYE